MTDQVLETEVPVDETPLAPPADAEPEAPETPPEETPAPAARLLAGKYATPDELETAYHEAEQELGRQRHEIGQLRKQTEQPTPTATQPPAPAEPEPLPELTQAEQQRLIPLAQRVMKAQMDAGYSEDDARNLAWQTVYAQAQISKYTTQAAVEPIRQEAAGTTYGTLATQAVSSVKEVTAPEVETALRQIDPRQWASMTPEQRTNAAGIAARMLAYEKLTSTPAPPGPPTPAPRVNVPGGARNSQPLPAAGLREIEAELRSQHPDLNDEAIRAAATRAARRMRQEEDLD